MAGRALPCPTTSVQEKPCASTGTGAQFVEVLGKAEFGEEHLPGAIHIPLRRLDRDGPEMLDRSRPVVVYCMDHQ